MSRRQGFIEERSPGSWLIRYDAGIDATTGKRRRLNLTVRGLRKDAERELRRMLQSLDDGTHIDPTRLTVREWFTSWLAAVRQEVSPRTHERYAELVEHFLAPALGNHPIGKLTPQHIADAYAALAIGGRRDGKPGGLSAQTRKHIHRVLHGALTVAVERQVIARNPAAVFRKRLPKVERREMTTLTADQTARLLDGIRQHRVYWPVMLALMTGMRRGEILALRWRNVDLAAGVLVVAEAMEHTKAGLRFKPPKSGKPRAITLPAFAVEELRRRRVEQAEEMLRLGVRLNEDMLVCARVDGEPMLPTSLTHEFAKVSGSVEGVPRVRLHDTRHSHATMLLAEGAHVKVISERLGHSSIGITMDLYSHVTPTLQRDAAEKLDTALSRGIRRRS
jgi:integrase